VKSGALAVVIKFLAPENRAFRLQKSRLFRGREAKISAKKRPRRRFEKKAEKKQTSEKKAEKKKNCSRWRDG
jgi:hypothetical protein